MRALLLALMLPGCAANLATLQGPHTLAPGQVSVTAELGGSVPVGATSRAVAAGVHLAQDASEMSQGGAVPLGTIGEAVGAGMGLALSPPGTVYGLSGRVGVVRDVDLGFRFSSTDIRLDGKWQLKDGGERGLSHAIALGWLHHRYGGILFDIYDPIQAISTFIPGLELEDPRLWDLQLRWLASLRPSEGVELYGGVEGRLRHYSVPWFLTGEDYGWPQLVSQQDQRGWNPMINATGGLAVGRAPIRALAELNVAYSVGRTSVLDVPVNFGGLILFPAIGLELSTRKRDRGEQAP